MIRKLATVVVLLLALNCLAIIAGVGTLIARGNLDRARARDVAKLLFPKSPDAATQPTTAPSAATQPLLRFDDLLAQQAGKTATQQVQFLRETFDGLSAQFDRQHRDLMDLKRQVDLAQAQLTRDREAVAAREKTIADRERAATAAATDAGFQRTMDIYDTMTPRTLKDVFAKQDDALVARYLQSMEPKRVSNILKEFKSPDEQVRANALLERLRTADVPAPAADVATTATPPR